MYFRRLRKGDACETKLNNKEVQSLARKVEKRLERKGYVCYPDVKGSHFELRNCRLSERRIKKHGYNVSPYTGRRGRILGWNNWVEVNNTINEVMDEENLCGKVDSLGGKFKIREGKTKFTEGEWGKHAFENVGSYVQPVTRRHAWHPER